MRSYLPVIYPAHGTDYPRIQPSGAHDPLYNCMPWMLHGNEIGACPRNELSSESASPTPAASTDRGRGVVSFSGQHALYVDETSYFYSGGNTDLTDTSAPGYAGNTGFNEEYIATFVSHKISGTPNLVIVNAGHTSTHASAGHGNVWYAADGLTAPASVSDADMPGNNGVSLVRGGASLDGYFFVGDINGQIHNSNLNDITAWTATDFLTASRDNGIGVYLGRHHNDVFTISTEGIEFFYNAGNASESPLAPRKDVYHSVGCYYPNSIVEVGDVVYFVGTEKDTGWNRLYKLQNYQLSVISDERIEGLLRDVGGDFPILSSLDSLIDNLWLTHGTLGDSPGLIITFNTSWTYYWHEKTNQWCRWSYGASVTYAGGTSSTDWSNVLPIVAFNGTISTNASARALYQFTNTEIAKEFSSADNDAMNDIGGSNAPDVYMAFPRWDGGTDAKKRITSIRVITSPLASDSGNHDPINVDLRWFDYKTAVASGGAIPPDTNYTTGRSVDLNVRGAKIHRCGTTRERSFILDWPLGHGTVTIVKGLEIEYEIVGE